MTRNSQPIGLWGTRIARIAPVIMYVTTDRTINNVNGSPEKVPFNVPSQSASTTSAAPTAIASQMPIRRAVTEPPA